MDEMRKTLSEILRSACAGRCQPSCFDCVADYLIKNGVTVWRYIPTAERLPSKEDANKSEQVMAYNLNYKRWERTHISWIIIHPAWYSHWTPIIEPTEPPGKEVGGNGA